MISENPQELIDRLPEFADVEAAAGRIAGQAVRTPLLESQALNRDVGGRVLIKPENLQRTGSFKFRGAYNRLRLIPEAARRRGVVAFSSGNHAQGVAAAAQMLDMPACIVMPADAPAIKIDNTRGYGAEVVLYDRYREARESIGTALVAERGATLIRPFDDPDIIAGQGTCGLEIAEQLAERGIDADQALINCGGGGLISGCALALTHFLPALRIHSVEPEGFDETRRSLEAGRRLQVEPTAQSICDALLSSMPGELTFALNSKLLEGGLAVSDAEVEAAMRYAFRNLKLVVEPGGAVTLAALLSGRVSAKDRTTVIVLSGGNVDGTLYHRILAGS